MVSVQKRQKHRNCKIFSKGGGQKDQKSSKYFPRLEIQDRKRNNTFQKKYFHGTRTGHRTKIHRGQLHARTNTNGQIHPEHSTMTRRSSPETIIHLQNTGGGRGDEIMQFATHFRSLFNRNNNKNLKFHVFFTSKKPKWAGSAATPSAGFPWNSTFGGGGLVPGVTLAGGGISWNLQEKGFLRD